MFLDPGRCQLEGFFVILADEGTDVGMIEERVERVDLREPAHLEIAFRLCQFVPNPGIILLTVINHQIKLVHGMLLSGFRLSLKSSYLHFGG